MSAKVIGQRIESRYRGCTVVVPTLHGKGAAIARALSPLLGVGVLELTVDTDRFGTFSGTVPRPGGAIGALTAKVQAARARVGEECIVVASEGSYGPHPSMPWLTLGTEWLRFSDPMRGEFDVRRSTTRPFLGRRVVHELGELHEAIRALGFPSHAVTLRPVGAEVPPIVGLSCAADVATHVRALLREHPGVEITNDLRAHLHPRRMRLIERTAWKLGIRLRTGCPACGGPGFGEPRTRIGLPCACCGSETSLPRARVTRCVVCAHEVEHPLPGAADPSLCPWCNP